MRKEGLENDTHRTRKQRITYFVRLSKWMAEQDLGEVTERESLRATMERMLWRVMIAYVLRDTTHAQC